MDVAELARAVGLLDIDGQAEVDVLVVDDTRAALVSILMSDDLSGTIYRLVPKRA